jgi:hypothetical protein
MLQSIKQIKKDLARINRAIKTLEARRVDKTTAWLENWETGSLPDHMASDRTVGLLIVKRIKLAEALSTLTDGEGGK